MKKFTGYKIWLISSVVVVLGTVALTALFTLTIPKDCVACGMAAVGLVPFWLLAFLALIANLIVVPIYLKKYKANFTPKLLRSSWFILVVSALAVVALVVVMALDF